MLIYERGGSMRSFLLARFTPFIVCLPFQRFAIIFLTVMTASLWAIVYSPKVVSEEVADVSGDWQNFLRHKKFRDSTGTQLQNTKLAYAVWQYLADTLTGVCHWGGTYDVPQKVPYSWQTDLAHHNYDILAMRDPIKNINVRGFGFCGILSSVGPGFLHNLGFTKNRVMDASEISGGHVTSEVWVDGDWAYLDFQVKGTILQNSVDTIASLDDWHNNASAYYVYSRTRVVPFFPGGDGTSFFQAMMNGAQAHPAEFRRYTLGHTMDFVLRTGETMTRHWQADSTRYLNNADWWSGGSFPFIGNSIIARQDKMPWLQQNGLYGNHYHLPAMVHWHYAPNLSSEYIDYADGYDADSGVTQTASGLAASYAQAYTIFAVRTPWPVAGKNGSNQTDLQNVQNQVGGAIIQLQNAGGNISVSVSRDEGFSWMTPALSNATPGPHTIDVTADVYGAYGYLVKIIFLSAGAGLSSLAMDTWCQAAAQSFPAILSKGVAKQAAFEYTAKDVKGYQTAPIRMFFEEVPSSPVHIKPPREGKIKWMSAGACFNNHRASDLIEYSTNGANWTRLCGPSDFGGDFNECTHWVCQQDKEVVFDTPVPEVWVRFTGATLPGTWGAGLRGGRIYAHYEEYDRPVTNSAVRITHKTVSAVCDTLVSVSGTDMTTYTASGMGVDEWIKMEVAGNVPTMAVEKIGGGVENGLVCDVFPNPFNPRTEIRISNIKQVKKNVEVKIFNCQGEMVQDLSSVIRHSSYNFIVWDAGNLPSGIYVVQVRMGKTVISKKAILFK